MANSLTHAQLLQKWSENIFYAGIPEPPHCLRLNLSDTFPCDTIILPNLLQRHWVLTIQPKSQHNHFTLPRIHFKKNFHKHLVKGILIRNILRLRDPGTSNIINTVVSCFWISLIQRNRFIEQTEYQLKS